MSLRFRVEAHCADGRPERAWEEAADAWRGAAPRERVFARRLLARIVHRVPDAAWTAERAGFARRLGIDRIRPAPEVGRVAFPAVNDRKGRFVEVQVSLAEQDEVPSGLPEAVVAAARDALEAVRRIEPGHRFRVEVPSDVPWEGKSWGLAVALAALSAVRGHRVSDRVVATGKVAPGGQIEDVGHRQNKVKLLVEARPRARMLVPEGWRDVERPGVQRCATLSGAWRELSPAEAAVDERLDEVAKLERGGRWTDAAALALALLEEELEDLERAKLLVVLHLDANHRADIDAQRKWDAELARVGPSGLDQVFAARALANRFVSSIDRLAPEEAESLLPLVDGRDWRAEAVVHVRGAQALWMTLIGDHDGALRLREANAEVAPAAERARCLGDLADAWLRLGDPERALACVDEARAAAERAGRWRGYQELTKGFLVLHRARALRALGRDPEALDVLREAPGAIGPDPQLRWRLLEAEIRGDVGIAEARWRSLPAWMLGSPVVQALFERTRARLGDGEAEASLLSRAVFGGLALAEAGRRLPY